MGTVKLSDQAKADAVREYEQNTTGSENFYRHPFGLIYTDGMRFVAETCGAYWLLDLVSSWQPAIKKTHREDALFQVWRVARGPTEGDNLKTWEPETVWFAEAWSNTPGDEDSQRFARQEIPYSDFPPELAPFEFYVENGTALLKGER